MFSRVQGIRLLTQARQNQVQAFCRCLANPSFHRLQPVAACSILQWRKDYHLSGRLEQHSILQTTFAKRGASTSVNDTTLTAGNVDSQLQVCADTLDLYSAIDIVEQAQNMGITTLQHYEQLFSIMEAVKADLTTLARIARWFTSPQGPPLAATTLEEQTVWKNALKACFRLARSQFQSELKDMLSAFSACVNLEQVHSADVWGVALRGYGILKQEDKLDAMIAKIPEDVDCLEAITIAYASAGAHHKADTYMNKLLQLRIPEQEIFQILAKTVAHEGNVERTKKILTLATKLFEGASLNQHLILAHKTKLSQLLRQQDSTNSHSGRNSSGLLREELDEARHDCEGLISNMLSDGYPLDISSANIIIDFLTLGNRIDHVSFPMVRARDIVQNVLPTKGIDPNFQSYFLVLRGYAKTRELDQPRHNARLDKCLEMFYLMEKAGFDSHPQARFQCLFEACLPHSNRFNFDNFRAKSLLAPTVQSSIANHHTPYLDPRLFDLERIMLEASIRHDRITIKTLLTCLGASGQYSAMWRRWKELQLAGVRRDGGLFQRIFALASLDPAQAQYALSVVHHELGRETPKITMTMGLYHSIIDCCIASQDALTAKSVLLAAGVDTLPSVQHIKTHRETQLKLLELRAQLGIRSLTRSISAHLKDMMDLRVPHKNDMWLMLMSHAVDAQLDMQDAQRVFNGFTMSRFEQTGKVPVPAHAKSPVIPFPSSPYSETDTLMIGMFLSALLRSQNIPVIRDVLETYTDQTSKLWISRDLVRDFVALAQREKSHDDVKWIVQNVLPKLSNQSSKYKHWVNRLQESIDKDQK